MADVTGMGQAQNTDKQTAQAGKARRAGRWMAEHVPVIKTKAKKEKEAREAEERIALEERVRHHTRKELESGVTPNIDPSTVKGEYTYSFNRQLLDAVRRGQTRTGSNTPDMLIRVTLTDPAFIQAIRTKAVPTPYEDADTEYAKEMVKRRQTLAAWLDMARQHSDYTLPKLTNHEIDIIYSTALGKPEYWEGKDRKGRDVWPESKPTPAESVLRFLESVAMRERPGGEGEFIGNVLKDISGRPTLLAPDSTPGIRTDHKLVSGAYINAYLHKKSAEPIDSAVDNFRHLVTSVLETPTTEMHSELGVPGVGYKDIYQGKLSHMNTDLGEARAAQRQAAAEVVAAQGSYDEVMATKEQAKERWARLPEATRKQITDAEGETKALLEQAKAKEAHYSSDVARIEQDIRKFKKDSGIEAVTQEVVDHFRAVLVQGNEVNADLSTIETKLEPRLRNPAVADVLEQAQELFLERRDSPKLATPEVAMILESINRALDERERLRPIVEKLNPREHASMLGRELRQLESDTAALKATIAGAGFGPEMRLGMEEVVSSVENFGIPRDYIDAKIRDIYLDDKAGRADRMLEDAPLPVDAKVEIAKTFASLRKGGFAEEAVKGEVAALMKASAFPLGRAAAISVKKLSRSDYENIVGITDAQRIVARMVWESTSSDSKDPTGKTEGRWMKFKQWLGWNFTTWEGFFARRAVVWTYETFLDGDIQDIRPKNALQKGSGKKPDGTPYKTKFPRVVYGISSLALKAYLVGAVAVYMTHDASFSQHFLRSPVSISRKAPYVNPFVWLQSPPRPPSEIVRQIHDHYDIPERLASRPDSYLRSAYGLGSRLPGEQSDERANARVAWVKDHPDVMRFFQERRSMREVISWEETPHNLRNPDMCSTSARRIPPVCQDAQYGLNLADAQAVQNYSPLDGNDGWRAEVPQMRVCCFVKLTTRPVSDGLMLNRSQSDRFVDALQAAERGGTRINSAYMRDAGNRARWVQEWFMITPMENDIMETFKIRDRDNVQFILTQGSKVSNVLLPRCGERGEERELIQEAHRDEFVRLWREEIGRQYQGHNPTVEDVPQETLTASFNAVRATAVTNHWVEDTTHEYDRRQVRRELQLLNLQTDTAIDSILAQQDLHDFVRLFATTSATYRINDQRSDEFVQVLVQHKMRNGSLNDFNPFAETQGARVQWAIGMGYLRQAEQFQGTQDRGNPAPGASGSAAQTPAPAPVPDLTPEAERFYASQSNESFRQFIEGITAGLHDDSRMDGRIMGDVLRTRFGGNRERMDRAIKAEVYRLLTSTGDRDAALRGGYGIGVTGSGDQMTVAMGNPRLARSSLRNHILQFVRAQGAIAVPPRR